MVLGAVAWLPNSLPSLHKLSIDVPMSAGLLGGIFAAAGPGLTTISIINRQTAQIALRLLAENDYAWAPALQSHSLHWEWEYGVEATQPWDSQMPLRAGAVEVFARLPALKSLCLTPRNPDELVVCLLALAEAGGLPNLATLEIRAYWPSLTAGAVLLLLLWLKREAKKALQGDGEAAKWDVQGLRPDGKHTALKQITETHLTRLEEARTHIHKARAAGGAGV